jgi:peptidoglycan/xylan/chitin deacetylase (PgdA/CDA1 family)
MIEEVIPSDPIPGAGLRDQITMADRIPRWIFSAARKLGIEAAVRDSAWRSGRLLILCWHGISLEDEHQWRPHLYITPEQFRARLTELAEGGYHVFPLGEGLERMQRRELPPRSVALTFDDGFFDFTVMASPVLEEFGYPATVYLTTFYVGHQQPVFPLIVSYLSWKATGDGDARRIVATAAVERWSTGDEDRYVRQLADEYGLDLDGILRKRLLHLMTAEEVAALSSAGSIRFEGHTHRHRTPPDPELIRRELRDNHARIESITGRRPVHFCYPSGVFRREYFPVLAEEGVLSATTCESGLAAPSHHRYLLPRLLDHSNLSVLNYRGWLSGVRGLGPRRPAIYD